MGLLSSKTFRQIATGVGVGVLGTIQEARAKSDDYLAELKQARDEVNEESQKIGANYDKALRVASGTGNSAFANFLFSEMSLDQLAGLSDLAPTTKDEQLSQLKNKFESLDPNIKATFEDSSYSEIAKEKYDTELDNLKIKKGLVNNNTMGNNTVESLITSGVRKRERAEGQKIMGQVVTPQIDVPSTEQFAGAYETIGQSAIPSKANFVRGYVEKTLADPTSASYFQQISGGKDVGTYYSELYDILYGSSEDNISGSVKSWQDYIQQQEG